MYNVIICIMLLYVSCYYMYHVIKYIILLYLLRYNNYYVIICIIELHLLHNYLYKKLYEIKYKQRFKHCIEFIATFRNYLSFIIKQMYNKVSVHYIIIYDTQNNI